MGLGSCLTSCLETYLASIILHICDFSIYFCISLGTYLGPTYLDITIQSFTSISCPHLRAWMLSRSLPLFKSPSLGKLRYETLAFFPAGGLVSFRCSAALVTTAPPQTWAVLSHTTTHHPENQCHELLAKNRLSIIDKHVFPFPSLTPNLTDGEWYLLAIRSRKPSRLEPWPVALSLKSHAPEGEKPLQLPLQGPAHPSSTWCTVNRA
jgi:hypothetical protein